ncbi:hypothetical protein [Actinoplanes sp. DH11]|uniref:hypothetical protein n=1 Tax=Actinoplanes sp. DH11 TaxID=2857011 RepID=UPI001E5909BB|nr:hypothetical protein [Actinoplanes sp. DH11]
MADDAVERELEEVTGNRKLAGELRRNLQTLREGAAGPDLAEMARDVLDGRISLRDVTRTSAYSAPLLEAMARFQQEQARLSDEERAELLDAAAEYACNPDEPPTN